MAAARGAARPPSPAASIPGGNRGGAKAGPAAAEAVGQQLLAVEAMCQCASRILVGQHRHPMVTARNQTRPSAGCAIRPQRISASREPPSAHRQQQAQRRGFAGEVRDGIA